ncbi:MAG: hypothetical protein IJ272_10855, partial [Clostridia bacterium]|nr:hypothetical protein [Clostridia bacterium]
MKINASIIGMESTRQYVNYTHKEEFSLTMTSEEAAKLELSDESISYVDQLKDYEKDKKEARKQQEQMNIASQLQLMASRNKKVEKVAPCEFEGNEKIQLEVLKRILESLNKYLGRGKKVKDSDSSDKCSKEGNSFDDAMKVSFGASSSMSFSMGISAMSVSGSGAGATGATTFVRTTAVSSFVTELENTTFKAQGLVKTADGREISFGVDLEMSRAFCAKYNSLSQEEVIFTDPLIINTDENITSLSDQKFLFDIDSDGDEEEISFANGGGFLALDKNNDGKVNDGSELFGTKSGNGFKDLAMYDSDGNGWIDENDSVFNDLKIWTKDEEGKDRLVSIKSAGVGAIYL